MMISLELAVSVLPSATCATYYMVTAQDITWHFRGHTYPHQSRQSVFICPSGTSAVKPVHMSCHIVRPSSRVVAAVLAFAVRNRRQIGQFGVMAGPCGMARTYVTVKVLLLCVLFWIVTSRVRAWKTRVMSPGVLPGACQYLGMFDRRAWRVPVFAGHDIITAQAYLLYSLQVVARTIGLLADMAYVGLAVGSYRKRPDCLERTIRVLLRGSTGLAQRVVDDGKHDRAGS